ncbi:unnamed protein product [Phyllotreta striolata]|uniref:Uncharacterized protein n=1 Tax=Phyllotreta striolata TaxID=444603 RepID=A0A9N9XKF0_PHYSR|nr:unnamed protein product [Phyllotreta striolata]
MSCYRLEFSALLIAFVIYCSKCNAIGVDDKLDFGNRRTSHSSIIKDGIVHTSFIPIEDSSSGVHNKQSDGFDNIGIVCVNEGCNTTKTSSDSIKTDVVVHIETKLDLNSEKTKVVDDVPDIPVVIGTDKSNTNYYQNTGSNVYSTSRPFYTYTPNRKFGSTSPYENALNPNPEVTIDIKSSPPITMDFVQDMLINRFQPNGLTEMTIPYFDPSLHSHHYSETPPPQQAFYPKHVSAVNPVEFKVMRPNWRVSQWRNQFNQRGAMPESRRGVKCYCEDENGRTDPHWYINRNSRSEVYSANRRKSYNDPGTQINDKLAPLE